MWQIPLHIDPLCTTVRPVRSSGTGSGAKRPAIDIRSGRDPVLKQRKRRIWFQNASLFAALRGVCGEVLAVGFVEATFCGAFHRQRRMETNFISSIR